MDATYMAQKLVGLRGKKTQKEVAEAVKISKSALGMYEKGKRIPRDEIKMRIANYYGKSVGFIFFNPNCHEK